MALIIVREVEKRGKGNQNQLIALYGWVNLYQFLFTMCYKIDFTV